jgi:hypothetical protein
MKKRPKTCVFKPGAYDKLLEMTDAGLLADKAPLWKRIQEKYNLNMHSYEELSSWIFGDAVFAWDYDFFADGTKARRLGFHEFVDTEQMFYGLLDELKAKKVIPL